MGKSCYVVNPGQHAITLLYFTAQNWPGNIEKYPASTCQRKGRYSYTFHYALSAPDGLRHCSGCYNRGAAGLFHEGPGCRLFYIQTIANRFFCCLLRYNRAADLPLTIRFWPQNVGTFWPGRRHVISTGCSTYRRCIRHSSTASVDGNNTARC